MIPDFYRLILYHTIKDLSIRVAHHRPVLHQHVIPQDKQPGRFFCFIHLKQGWFAIFKAGSDGDSGIRLWEKLKLYLTDLILPAKSKGKPAFA
jgi:hypothetical protein